MRLFSIVISGIVAITRWWEWPIIIWREPRRRARGTTRARGIRLLGRGRRWRINTTQKSTRWARIWKLRHGFQVRFLLDHCFWSFRTINNRIPQMYIFYFEKKNWCLWIHVRERSKAAMAHNICLGLLPRKDWLFTSNSVLWN